MSTPNPKALYTTAQTAESIFNGFAEIAQIWRREGQFYLTVATNIDGLQFGELLSAESLKSGNYREFLNKVAKKPTVICSSALLQFREAGREPQEAKASQISYKTDNGVVGEFSINFSNCPEDITAVLESLVEKFKITTYLDLARTNSPSIDDAALQLRERSVADLKEQVAKLAEFLTRMAEREAKNREKIQTKLDQAHQERADKLDAEYRARREEFETLQAAETAKLDEKTRVLEEKRKALDLRDEQGVRRELLDKIQTVLKEAEVHNASASTQDKRYPIQRLAIGLMALGAIIAGFSGYRVFSSGNTDWHFWVVFASSITTIISTAIYYLKWSDRWFREHADAEFAAKRYKADILRASWLAELAGEWKKTKDGETLSPLLIEAFGRNLFANISISSPSEHPLDEVTNLLKRASEVNFGKTGFSLKGIKSPAKTEE
jgi:hypothetical protein